MSYTSTEDLRDFVNHNCDLKGVLAFYAQQLYQHEPDLQDNYTQDQVVATFMEELLEQVWTNTGS